MVRAFDPPVYCYHEIVHNRLVVDRFRRLGVVFVDDVTEVPEGRPALGHFCHVINEHNPQSPKTIYDQAVMNNFVVAVDRRIERPHHPSKSFDRHFDPSTKPPRRSQQNLLNAHETEVTGSRLVAGCRPTPGNQP